MVLFFFASAICLGPLFSPGLGVVWLWFIGRGVLLWLIHTCAAAPYGNAAAAPRSAAMDHKCAAAPHRSPGKAHRSAESNTWCGPACGLDDFLSCLYIFHLLFQLT